MYSRNLTALLITTLKTTAVATVLGLTPAVSVCAQTLDSPSTTPAQGANRPIDVQGDGRQQALDQATTARVRAALQTDSELKTQMVLIETVNGSVRLTGQVSSGAHFDRAKDLVTRVEGVKSVDNLLVVKAIRPE